MSSQDNVQTLKEMYAAFKQGDLDGVMAHVAEDIELLAPSLGEFPWGGTFRGRAAYRDRLAGLDEHFTVEEFDQLHFLPGDGVVAVVSRWVSTLKKNGERIRIEELVQLVSFDDSGKCTRFSEMYDPTETLAAWRK
ncbi:MAG: nuclear transport factor 2 family protein [Gammaproteobacteria bacterium]